MDHTRTIDWTKISYVGKGILVGAVAGTIVSLFRMVIGWLLGLMPYIYAFLRENKIWIIGWVLLVLMLGLIVAKLVNDEPKISGNGVAEIKGKLAGLFRLNWISVLIRKFIGSVIVIGLGIPVGRNGPSIQIGGVSGQGVNSLLKGSKSEENILVSSGVAAGLSAAFNAPLSGLVYVLEQVHQRFSSILILAVFSSSIVASFVAFRLFGTEPAVSLSPVGEFPMEYFLYLILFGVLLALVGSIFQRMSLKMSSLYSKIPVPKYIIILAPFVLVILIGLFWPEMLGGGASVIKNIARQRTATTILLVMFVFRLLAFVASFGSKIPGGMLMPMLTMGALTGAIFGNFTLSMTGLENVFIRSFVIYGMAGFMSVVYKTPLTAIVLTTELTGSITQMMPISIVSLTAYIIADISGIKPADEITLKSISQSIPKVFEGKLESITVFVEADSNLDGAVLKEYSFPYNAQISKITRHKNEFIPHKDTVFFQGDEITISVDSGFVKEVNKYIDKIN